MSAGGRLLHALSSRSTRHVAAVARPGGAVPVPAHAAVAIGVRAAGKHRAAVCVGIRRFAAGVGRTGMAVRAAGVRAAAVCVRSQRRRVTVGAGATVVATTARRGLTVTVRPAHGGVSAAARGHADHVGRAAGVPVALRRIRAGWIVVPGETHATVRAVALGAAGVAVRVGLVLGADRGTRSATGTRRPSGTGSTARGDRASGRRASSTRGGSARAGARGLAGAAEGREQKDDGAVRLPTHRRQNTSPRLSPSTWKAMPRRAPASRVPAWWWSSSPTSATSSSTRSVASAFRQ
jgi:hypothetical protein